MLSKLKGRKRSFKSSFRDCLNGLSFITENEKNFKREILIAVITLLFSIILKVDIEDFIIILVAIFLVLIMEIINTAIEKVVDLYTKEYNEIARIAKDVSAGAVLTASFFAVIVGIIIFIPKIINLLGGI